MGGQNTGTKLRFLNSLTREQKLTLGVFVVCGIIVFVLSIVQVRRALYRPFTASLAEFVAFERTLEPSEEEKARQQQETDTDGDGMSDWQELNMYHTSPYLADSDSDGAPDNIEIARGTDPNCPEGEPCSGSFGSTGVATSTASPEDFGVSAPTGGGGSGVPSRDPEAIRTFLRLRGMTDAQLSGYSDEDLLNAYDAAASGNGTLDTNTQTNGAQPTQP